MAKPELGTKRVCPACATKYYDLGRSPITCPNCGTVFEPVVHHRAAARAAAAAPVVADEEEVEAVVAESDVEIVSLEEAEEGEAPDVGPEIDEEEDAVIPDADIEIDEEIEAADDDPAFLADEEEEGDDVADLLDVEGKEDDEV